MSAVTTGALSCNQEPVATENAAMDRVHIKLVGVVEMVPFGQRGVPVASSAGSGQIQRIDGRLRAFNGDNGVRISVTFQASWRAGILHRRGVDTGGKPPALVDVTASARYFSNRQVVREAFNIRMAGLADKAAMHGRCKLLGIHIDALSVFVHEALLAMTHQTLGVAGIRPSEREDHQ